MGLVTEDKELSAYVRWWRTGFMRHRGFILEMPREIFPVDSSNIIRIWNLQ